MSAILESLEVSGAMLCKLWVVGSAIHKKYETVSWKQWGHKSVGDKQLFPRDLSGNLKARINLTKTNFIPTFSLSNFIVFKWFYLWQEKNISYTSFILSSSIRRSAKTAREASFSLGRKKKNQRISKYWSSNRKKNKDF